MKLKSTSWQFLDKIFFFSCLIPIIETLYLLSGRLSFYTFLNGIPITDSKGWFGCIKSLAYTGSWPAESVDWCLRRPFYPIFASQIYKFMPSLDAYFIICSTAFTLILMFTVTQVRKIGGDLAGWVVILGSSALWFVYGATQTLSEQAGITLGTLGLGYFMRYLLTHQNINLYMGSIFFLTAQMTRPGNVFCYMFPVFLVVLFANQRMKVLAQLIAVSYMPLAILVVTVRNYMGIPNFMHSGNTWATIYGLQFDNQSWAASYSILPKNVSGEIAIWSYIKDRTLQNIFEHPLNIPKSVLQNIWNIIDFGPLNLPIFLILVSVFSYSFIYIYRKSILPGNLMVLVLFALISELLTFGVSYNSEPIRTMSTSLIFSTTLIVLPLSAFIRYNWLSSKIKFQTVEPAQVQNFSFRTLFVPGLVILALSLQLFIPQGPRNLYVASRDDDQCEFQITLRDFPSSFVQQQDLERIRGTHGEWWIESIQKLGTGSFLLTTSVDDFGATRDSSIYLRKYFVGDLRNGDTICVLKSQVGALSELGFQEGILMR